MSSGKSRDEPVWARTAPGSRKPAYSRELIVQTALAIADAEGFEALSMRRIASELGAGTMTIYHYVATKDELINLVGDAVMADMIIPDDELPGGWREGMAEIARRTLRIFDKHPWIVEHMGEGDPDAAGPNVLRHVEQTLAVASLSGLGLDEQFELAAIVDDYVFGHAMRRHTGSRMESTPNAKQRLDAMLRYLTEELGSGDYPHLAAAAGDDPAAGFARVMHLAEEDDRFERGLQRVLDGLELWVKQAKRR
jgi:AcrR family transcriptional regulator